MIKGFRDFILRGNVIDLAVAVVLGAAFGAVEVLDREQVPHAVVASWRLEMVTSSAPSSSATWTFTRSDSAVGRFLPT